MKKSVFIRCVAATLLAAMLTATCACSEPVKDNAETKSADTVSADTTEAVTELDCNLPDNLDFESQDVRFLNYNYF